MNKSCRCGLVILVTWLCSQHVFALSWIEKNLGQINSQHRYIVHAAGVTALVEPTYIDMVVVPAISEKDTHIDTDVSAAKSLASVKPLKHAHTTRLILVDANVDAKVEGLVKAKGVSNYLRGNNQKKWITKIPHYHQIKVANVYQGIDLVYKLNNGKLEYDFVVAPYADAAQIVLSVEGISKSWISNDDKWRARTPYGDIVQSIPEVYELVDGQKRLLKGTFQNLENGSIGFAVERNDVSARLVVDPVIEFSGYFGGSRTDVAYSLLQKQNGNFVIAGTTNSILEPISGASDIAVNQDLFAAEMSSADGELLWLTIFGGSLADNGERIKLDNNDDIVFVGYTSSRDFPTVNAFQSFFADNGLPGDTLLNTDGVVAKLAADDGNFVFSTYLGGRDTTPSGTTNYGFEFFRGLDTDSENNIYVVGQTAAPDFPATTIINGFACFERELDPSAPLAGSTTSDIAFAKFSADGERLFSACIGGSYRDAGRSVLIDDNDSVYLAGFSNSSDFPITPGVFQSTLTESGEFTPFVLKLSKDLTAVNMATFVAEGFLWEIDIDTDGNIYGVTDANSHDLPTTIDAFQPQHSDTVNDRQSDGYVFKLNSMGTELLYGTYLGAPGDDRLSSIVVDDRGRAFVAGRSESMLFPQKNPLTQEPEHYLRNSDVGIPSQGHNHISQVSRRPGSPNYFLYVSKNGTNLLAVGDSVSLGQFIPFVPDSSPNIPQYNTSAMAGSTPESADAPSYVLEANRDGVNRVYSLNPENFSIEWIADVGLASDESRDVAYIQGSSFLVANYGKANSYVRILPGDPNSVQITSVGRTDGNTTALTEVKLFSVVDLESYIAVANEHQDIRLFRPSQETQLDYVAGAVTGMSAGDIDGLEGEELVIANSDGAVEILYLELISGFPSVTNVEQLVETGAGSLSVLVVDVDDDGDRDIIVGRTENDMLFLNDGNGNFSIESSYIGSTSPTKSIVNGRVLFVEINKKCPCFSIIDQNPQEIHSSKRNMVLSVLNQDGSDLEFSSLLTGDGYEDFFLGMKFARGSDSKVLLAGSSTGNLWPQVGTNLNHTEAADAVFMMLELDQDGDGVLDGNDNCLLVANPDQRDTNDDGFGNICDPDLNNDGVVNFIDVSLYTMVFLTDDPDADLDGNGTVGFLDYALLVNRFLQAPGPGLE